LLNPTLDKQFIKGELKKDPALAQAEWLGRFRSDIESFVVREAVEGCVVPGRIELPPVPDVRYRAFVDVSGGARDSFAWAISHIEPDGKRVLDLLREVKPPFSPDQVVSDCNNDLKRYGITKTVGDRYGGAWPAERFQAHGVSYQVSKKTKSDIYKEFLPLINSNEIELLDNERLINQITNLERRVARGGRDSIDHPPNSKDDLANVAAGVLVGEMRRSARIRVITPGASTTKARELPPEMIQEHDLIRVINQAGKLVGHETRMPAGTESKLNLVAICEQGELVAYRRVAPQRNLRGRLAPLQ